MKSSEDHNIFRKKAEFNKSKGLEIHDKEISSI
jgi:hypothetical protein